MKKLAIICCIYQELVQKLVVSENMKISNSISKIIRWLIAFVWWLWIKITWFQLIGICLLWPSKYTNQNFFTIKNCLQIEMADKLVNFTQNCLVTTPVGHTPFCLAHDWNHSERICKTYTLYYWINILTTHLELKKCFYNSNNHH